MTSDEKVVTSIFVGCAFSSFATIALVGYILYRLIYG